MVVAYWLIGREIVEEQQKGKQRAGYGKYLIDSLSQRLTEKYGKGFSTTNLRYFRTFYQKYSDRLPEIRHMPCGESEALALVAAEKTDEARGFHPDLGWSHYRILMKVENKYARLFYEIEAAKEMWSVPHLDRQINSLLFERLLKSRDKGGVMALANEGQVIRQSVDVLKDPYVLDFLQLPDAEVLHESDLESAIIDNLQHFLLELGKGFSFVARQKRLKFEDENFYVDLIFYNYILKCFVLIDIKIGKLSHQDIGQMDTYVRLYEEHFKIEGDNPTIGLILCSSKNEAIVRYSVLHESRQIFASKYKLYLPTEEELRQEIKREREKLEKRRLLSSNDQVED